jgi:hypothetical protein
MRATLLLFRFLNAWLNGLIAAQKSKSRWRLYAISEYRVDPEDAAEGYLKRFDQAHIISWEFIALARHCLPIVSNTATIHRERHQH